MDVVGYRIRGKQKWMPLDKGYMANREGLIPEVFRGQSPLAVAWHHVML